MSRPEDEGGFLNRWARRKREAQAARTARSDDDGLDSGAHATPAGSVPSPRGGEGQDEGVAEFEILRPAPPHPALSSIGRGFPINSASSDARLPTGERPVSEKPDLPVPSLDDVLPGRDVSAFFQAHVPEALRKAALRKLWTTDPEISGFIEMADYQWDFNNPDAIPGWGSTLPTTDVERLLGRLLDVGGGRAPDRTPAAAPVDADSSPPPAEGLPIDAAAVGPPPAAPLDESTTSNIALQNKQEETVVYGPMRKRHGGALPT